MNYNIAQINVARMIGVNIEDPVMKEFVDNLDKVNQLAENSEGFVWRLKDESNNAASFNPFNDEQVIINISVWKNITSLENFIYQTFHTEFLKRRKEWFNKYGKTHFALWWTREVDFPTIEESIDRLEHLQINGPSERAFNFKVKFPSPNEL
ncbi:DUF3291 domain-containing protein [Flagellimonas sp. S3867]|uniref:DUF3291 domain-containing protein n=1 Tax=Flagellimonas sp. S3867 TaxID=2768063 RepID=UPI0016888283|nr:DUF3291 domain-containing protein [Flagellimonas sp. S3867]